jgi:hypothetical protein
MQFSGAPLISEPNSKIGVSAVVESGGSGASDPIVIAAQHNLLNHTI